MRPLRKRLATGPAAAKSGGGAASRPPLTTAWQSTPAAMRQKSVVRLQMPVGACGVAVRFAEFNIDQIQTAVPYAALCDDLLRKLAHSLDGSLQHNRLDALVMIQMRMHGGNRQVMVRVLNARQT